MAISQFTPECDLMARFFIILAAFVMLVISCCLLSELKKEEPSILVLGAREALLEITKAAAVTLVLFIIILATRYWRLDTTITRLASWLPRVFLTAFLVFASVDAFYVYALMLEKKEDRGDASDTWVHVLVALLALLTLMVFINTLLDAYNLGESDISEGRSTDPAAGDGTTPLVANPGGGRLATEV